MTVLEFANEVAANVENAKVQEIEKANGVVFTGIAIDQGGISPTVYVDEMYRNGLSVEDAAREVERIAEKSRVEGFNAKQFLDYEGFVKGNLRIRLYNKATKAEVCRSAKARGFDDLIMVPYVNIEIPGHKGAVRVLNKHLDVWGVSQREVIDTAIKNSMGDTTIQTLAAFMGNMMFGGGPDFIKVSTETQIQNEPLVISNSSLYFGASSILGLIPRLKEKFIDGFYAIPSSVHEIIIMPKGLGEDAESLAAMIKEVNATTLSPEEVLSSKAYAF